MQIRCCFCIYFLLNFISYLSIIYYICAWHISILVYTRWFSLSYRQALWYSVNARYIINVHLLLYRIINKVPMVSPRGHIQIRGVVPVMVIVSNVANPNINHSIIIVTNMQLICNNIDVHYITLHIWIPIVRNDNEIPFHHQCLLV